MPVVGFISMDGTTNVPERGGKCTFDFALKLAESGDSEAFPYPYPLLKGIVDSIQDRDYISVTTILHCLRAAYLKRTEDYYISVEQAYPMFRGTLFHSLMEKNPNPNGKIEEKVSRSHRGILLTGTYDSMVLAQDAGGKFILHDWKTTNDLPRYDSPYSSHLAQINLYRWLLGLTPEEVIMEVWYFSMKGVKRCRLKDGTQKTRTATPVNQHWSDEKVEAFLDDRLVKYKLSLMLKQPLPYSEVTEDEKWECPYCPVKDICDSRAVDEREAVWRKKAGLSPAGTPSDLSPEWQPLMEYGIRTITAGVKGDVAPPKPPDVMSKPVQITPAPKPVKAVRARRGTAK